MGGGEAVFQFKFHLVIRSTRPTEQMMNGLISPFWTLGSFRWDHKLTLNNQPPERCVAIFFGNFVAKKLPWDRNLEDPHYERQA